MQHENKIPRVNFEIEGDSLRVFINEAAAPDLTYAKRELRAIDNGTTFFKRYGRDWNRLQREATIRMEHEPRMTEQGVRRLVKSRAIKATEDGIYIAVTRLAARPVRLFYQFCVVSGAVFLLYMGRRVSESFSLSQAIASIGVIAICLVLLWLEAYFTRPRRDLDRAIGTLKKGKASAVQSANSGVGVGLPAPQIEGPPARILKAAVTRREDNLLKVIYAQAEELSMLKPRRLDFLNLGPSGDRISEHLDKLGPDESLTSQTAVKYLRKAIIKVGQEKKLSPSLNSSMNSTPR